jgi:hypothetical protein
VNQKAIVDVVVRAAQDADPPTSQVVGVTGAWTDSNDNGIVESTDSFACSGIGTSTIRVH